MTMPCLTLADAWRDRRCRNYRRFLRCGGVVCAERLAAPLRLAYHAVLKSAIAWRVASICLTECLSEVRRERLCRCSHNLLS